MEIKIKMKLKKSTPGTHVFEAETTGAPPAVKTLYVAKWAMQQVPQDLTLTITT